MGVVDAVGASVTKASVGDRVAALTGHGGYTEVIYLGQEHLVPVSAALDPADVVVLILNYTSAYQMLHRVARAKPGAKALVIGASGGVGTALLELGRLAGLKMYGTASSSKHAILNRLGAILIDYHTLDFGEFLRQAEPDGLDYVFNGQGGEYSQRGLAVLRRGGKLVEYAAPTGVSTLLLGLLKLAMVNLLPNGKSAEFYGITALYMRNKKPFFEDILQLFKLLDDGKIHPIVTHKLPLLEARKANELLESGQVAGNIVLLAPELLPQG